MFSGWFDEAMQKPLMPVDQWEPPRTSSGGKEAEMALVNCWSNLNTLRLSPSAEEKGGLLINNMGLFAFEVFPV